MNFDSLFTLFVKVFGTYETDKAIIDAGGVASTPNVVIGSNNGHALYARLQLCTNPAFPETPQMTANAAVLQHAANSSLGDVTA